MWVPLLLRTYGISVVEERELIKIQVELPEDGPGEIARRNGIPGLVRPLGQTVDECETEKQEEGRSQSHGWRDPSPPTPQPDLDNGEAKAKEDRIPDVVRLKLPRPDAKLIATRNQDEEVDSSQNGEAGNKISGGRGSERVVNNC